MNPMNSIFSDEEIDDLYNVYVEQMKKFGVTPWSRKRFSEFLLEEELKVQDNYTEDDLKVLYEDYVNFNVVDPKTYDEFKEWLPTTDMLGKIHMSADLCRRGLSSSKFKSEVVAKASESNRRIEEMVRNGNIPEDIKVLYVALRQKGREDLSDKSDPSVCAQCGEPVYVDKTYSELAPKILHVICDICVPEVTGSKNIIDQVIKQADFMEKELDG